jgi:hypothetical protein
MRIMRPREGNANKIDLTLSSFLGSLLPLQGVGCIAGVEGGEVRLDFLIEVYENTWRKTDGSIICPWQTGTT